MKNEEFIELIDAYLNGKMDDKTRDSFISSLRQDIDKLIDVEINRVAAIQTRAMEKGELAQRFAKKYKPSSFNEAKIIRFDDQQDDKIVELMNAAFAKNINIFENRDTSVNWELIKEFLEGNDDDE